MTQKELAGQLGVTFAALNRWLNGHAKPHPKKQEAIGKLYRRLVGFPTVSANEVRRLVRKADSFRRKELWDFLRHTKSLQEELLLEHTYNSTTIEGNTLTKRETEAIIFRKSVIEDKSLVEHLEVTNHAAVLRGIFERKHEGRLTERLIQEIHKELMTGIRPDGGEYSRHQRVIRGLSIQLTHPKDIPEEMAGLIRWWSRLPKVSIKEIAHFHASFELIHPFGDGNGRVGRLVMALQCLGDGLPPIVIENARKMEYYEVLEYAQTKAEGPFIRFLVDELERTSGLIRKYRR